MVPVRAAYCQPHFSCVRRMRSSRMLRGKSRSISGTLVMTSSGRNLSSDRLYWRGSMCDRAMREPPSMKSTRAIAPHGGLVTELFQVALGGMAFRGRIVREDVAEVAGQLEGA